MLPFGYCIKCELGSIRFQRHGAYTVNGKCQKRTARRYGKQRRKSFSKQKVGPKIRKERKIPVIQTMQVSRPPTPLTPSLDPELLRKFEEEDRPKRVSFIRDILLRKMKL